MSELTNDLAKYPNLATMMHRGHKLEMVHVNGKYAVIYTDMQRPVFDNARMQYFNDNGTMEGFSKQFVPRRSSDVN